jgi:endoglycosylceramidase
MISVAYWQKVVSEFKGYKNVLGYELINEPWVGQFYRDMSTAWGPNADLKRLQPLYDLLHSAIREVDTEKLVFFESINTDLAKVGFSHVPGGPSAANKSVLAWHYYFNPIGKQAYVRSRYTEGRRLGGASFATEFDISWDGTLRPNLTK